MSSVASGVKPSLYLSGAASAVKIGLDLLEAEDPFVAIGGMVLSILDFFSPDAATEAILAALAQIS